MSGSEIWQSVGEQSDPIAKSWQIIFLQKRVDTAVFSLYNVLVNKVWRQEFASREIFPQEKENFKKPVDKFGEMVYNRATEDSRTLNRLHRGRSPHHNTADNPKGLSIERESRKRGAQASFFLLFCLLPGCRGRQRFSKNREGISKNY
ncbi:MAG: hypothetical protein IJZ08_08875 [Clostridia bacterium]|nr:hypothetical protein [Clostridia bacterium]